MRKENMEKFRHTRTLCAFVPRDEDSARKASYHLLHQTCGSGLKLRPQAPGSKLCLYLRDKGVHIGLAGEDGSGIVGPPATSSVVIRSISLYDLTALMIFR